MTLQITLAVQKLERKIRERVELETGFASQNIQFRHLLHLLRFYDKTSSGSITYPHFQEFVLRMNCMSGFLARDVEFLFFRHDHFVLGYINCKEFAEQIYGIGPYPLLSREQLEVLEQMRRVICQNDVHAAVRFAWDIKEKCERITTPQCVQQVYAAVNQRVSQKNLFHLLDAFSKDNRVDVTAFLRSFQFGMTPDRKKLVRLLFETLDVLQHGTVTSSQLLHYYQRSNTISFRGSTYPSPPFDQLMSMMKGFDFAHRGRDVDISFADFLDYYSYLSLGVADDDFFDFILRSSWNVMSTDIKSFDVPPHLTTTFADSLNSSPGSLRSPSTSSSMSLWMSGDERLKSPKRAIHRRVMVSHSNDSEEAVDLIDEIGKTQLDPESIYQQVLERGVRDIVRINY